MKLTFLNICAILSLMDAVLSISSSRYSFYHDDSDFRLSYNIPTSVWDKYKIMLDWDLTYVNLAKILPKSKIDMGKDNISTAEFTNISIVIAALGLDSTHLSDRVNDFYTSIGTVKQQVDYDNGWWYNTYESISLTDKSSLKAWLKEITRSTITFLIELGSNVATICSSITSAVKSGSTIKSCNRFSYYLNLNAPGEAKLTYLVGISPYTSGSNCDTQAMQQSIQDLTSEWLVETIKRNLASYCSRFHDGDTLWADVRVSLCQENCHCASQYIWNIPCEDR